MRSLSEESWRKRLDYSYILPANNIYKDWHYLHTRYPAVSLHVFIVFPPSGALPQVLILVTSKLSVVRLCDTPSTLARYSLSTVLGYTWFHFKKYTIGASSAPRGRKVVQKQSADGLRSCYMPSLHLLGQTQNHIYISQPSCDGKTLGFLRCSVIHMLPLPLCVQMIDPWHLRYRDKETFRVIIMGIFGVKYAEDNLVFGIDFLGKQ